MADGQAEVKQFLRKIEFPQCSKEALNSISNLICTRAPSIKQMDLALDLMAEFVFCEVDRRGNKRPLFSPLKELQLLEVLFDFLNNITSDASRNTIFLTLFSGTTATQRLGILSKLVSLALGTQAIKILNSASTWMQQLGNTSTNSCKLAESLITDYFILIPNCLQHMQELPSTTPQFAANFLTATTELYFQERQSNSPPPSLLSAITLWVSSNYSLCIAAQVIQSPLPPGAIAMEATTPISGLLKWTILAPISNIHDELYAQLHLGILNSLLEIPMSSSPRAVCATHLNQINGAILKYVVDLELKAKYDKVQMDKKYILSEDMNLQIALDRFAQAIQVSLSVKCIYGNIEELINQLSYLPDNSLVKIIISSFT